MQTTNCVVSYIFCLNIGCIFSSFLTSLRAIKRVMRAEQQGWGCGLLPRHTFTDRRKTGAKAHSAHPKIITLRVWIHRSISCQKYLPWNLVAPACSWWWFHNLFHNLISYFGLPPEFIRTSRYSWVMSCQPILLQKASSHLYLITTQWVE